MHVTLGPAGSEYHVSGARPGAPLAARCKNWRDVISHLQLERFALRCEIVFVTLVMGLTEVNDPVTLTVFAVCGLVLVNGTVFLTFAKDSVAAAASATLAVDVCVLISFWKIRAMVRKIEAMDKTAIRFDTVWEKLCEGTSERGPAVRTGDPRQPFAAHDLDGILERAEALRARFDTVVGRALEGALPHGEAEYTSCCKAQERAHEKISQEYNNDATRLKDALRCCSVVPDLAAISVSYAKLEELERAGEIRILTVKNRFLKGEELPSGYRDVNVCVEFQGFLAEVQLLVRPLYELKCEAHPTYEICRSLDLVGPSRRTPPRPRPSSAPCTRASSPLRCGRSPRRTLHSWQWRSLSGASSTS